MCGITGFINFKKNIHDSFYILQNMSKTLQKSTLSDEGFYFSKHAALSTSTISNLDMKNNKKTMSFVYENKTYTILYSGRIYNLKNIYKELLKHNFSFKTTSDAEILLKAYIHFGNDVCKFLNGMFSFAIWNNDDEELFIARDHFGIQPLYYCFINDTFIFGNQIKAILEFPECKAILNLNGIAELFGLGPCHSIGITPFKNILELEPAHFIVLKKDVFYKKEYWSLKTKKHEDNFETTCEKIKFLIKDSIEKQLISDKPISCLLSGGLDSSIITAIASNYYKKNFNTPLNTFSVDYLNQNNNFIKNDFQPDLDEKYIDIMVKTFRYKASKNYT